MLTGIRSLSVVFFSLVISSSISCQTRKVQTGPADKTVTGNDKIWQGKEAVIVLTYDDALNVHLTNAIPALDSVGLKATFYISDYFGGLKNQIPKWKAAATNGHELANHTVFHPCEGNRPGRQFVQADYNLNNYSLIRLTDEIKTMNNLLFAMDSKTQRTFAFPCSDTKLRDSAYYPHVQNEFVLARAVRNEIPTIDKVDLQNVPSYMVNGETGDQLIELVKQAEVKKGLLVFLFHGVGGEHGLNVSLDAHTKLLQYLKQNQSKFWIAPMVDVGLHIKAYQQNK